MNSMRSTRRRYAIPLLLLSGVLVLGIVQWSFLPILIQNGPVGSKSVLEMSAGHSSKFAAPYKFLFGDNVKPRRVQSVLDAPRIPLQIVPPHSVYAGAGPCGD